MTRNATGCSVLLFLVIARINAAHAAEMDGHFDRQFVANSNGRRRTVEACTHVRWYERCN